MDGVLKEGFVTTSLDSVINWSKTGSLWPMTFGLACCAVEMMHAGAARYDIDRFGMLFRPSPRQSDLMIVAGTLCNNGAGAAQGLRPDGRAALGHLDGLLRQRAAATTTTAIGGARLRPDRAGRRLRAGCPPTAEALLYGILQLQAKIRRETTIAR